jgi:hypothetical protein
MRAGEASRQAREVLEGTLVATDQMTRAHDGKGVETARVAVTGIASLARNLAGTLLFDYLGQQAHDRQVLQSGGDEGRLRIKVVAGQHHEVQIDGGLLGWNKGIVTLDLAMRETGHLDDLHGSGEVKHRLRDGIDQGTRHEQGQTRGQWVSMPFEQGLDNMMKIFSI